MEAKGEVETLAVPAVTALKSAEGGSLDAWRGRMERTTSSDIRQERQELREAAEQTVNVILDIDLEGKIRWVSPSWLEIVGTPPEALKGKAVADIVLDEDKSLFANATEFLREDVAGSKIIHFCVQMGEHSMLIPPEGQVDPENFPGGVELTPDHGFVLTLEGQGIMIYDRSTGAESHSMWMVRPAIHREVTIDLPHILIESLGEGAEMLAQHLTRLAETGTSDPEHHPPPLPVLCRICERQITPWWFPKHTELCLQEHQAEAELQLAQENLTDHRNAIVKVLDALEAQMKSRSHPQSESGSPAPQPEYKGVPIGSDSVQSSGRASPAYTPSTSRDRSASGQSHSRARSFAVRRPLSRIVELILDLCDTALEINQPVLKDTRGQEEGELRTQSPQSENRISQVLGWQHPSANTLDDEPGLSSLCDDTFTLSKAKIDKVMLFRRILEYSERIRTESTSLVQECIDAALEKAARIAAGDISGESSDESMGKEDQSDVDESETKEAEEREEKSIEPVPIPKPSPRMDAAPVDVAAQPETLPPVLTSSLYDGQSAMSYAFRKGSTRSPSPSSSPSRRLSSALSTRSSSPKPCPTPKSQAATGSATVTGDASVSTAESDAGGESDGSARSTFRSNSREGGSPSGELSLSRVPTNREKKRTSLVLPRAHSVSRQESPARSMAPPGSPLRVTKPRFPSGALETAKSPISSPQMGFNEFSSPTLSMADINHRRQSSAASSDLSRAAVSPHMSFAHHPQPRSVPPSIKDFEIVKPISKGAFGSVYLAKKKSTGDHYAIKALKKQDMVAKNQVANVKAERAILMFQGESDFVAKLYWTFPSKDYIFLVMEYLNGGDCASLVSALGTLPEDWAKRYLAEVVQGVEHLHSRGIVHRDLKPDNLLIDQKGHLKLTDFGLSRMGLIGRQKRALRHENSGSAPDPLKQGPFQRSVSMTSSSRSTSFDVHGTNPSPGNTPHLTPAYPQESSQPSYFSLSREPSSAVREPMRQNSGQQSETSDTDQLQAAFRRFSIYDELFNASQVSSREDQSKDGDDSADGLSLRPTTSHTDNPRNSTPPQTAGNMAPPPMALFDPDDVNRRFVGTPDYLAPETINGLGQDEMSDWWSLGCILFEFLFGYPPFHAETPDEVFENILHRKIDWPQFDHDVSAEARDLMDRLMCLDPADRLGANAGEQYPSGGEEIKMHPWFADIQWDTLNETEASFVPAPESIEDTEYFDARGATQQDFAAQFEDQSSSPGLTPSGDFERPHDALARVRTQVNSMKKGLMPLHIPPHVRDNRNRRQSEPAVGDDFGHFAFKNLPVLEKANKDVIQKLRAEAMQAQARSIPSTNQPGLSNSPPSLESSPVIGATVKRALSTNRGNHRSASPSTLSHANSSPSRASQPSSPLVQFSAGGNHERRKTSGGSQTADSTQRTSFFDIPKLSTSIPTASTSSSPVKSGKPAVVHEEPPQSATSPRTRSHTIGSNESDLLKERIAQHSKRRSQVIEVSPSSSDTEDPRQKALLRVQRRRQSSRRLSQITLEDGPIFRPLDILVVEDHPVSRLVMEKLLEKLRCRAIIVQDGAEAMRYAMSSVKFDIMMMEFKLPQINGADVARMLRETKNANCHTPIVAVTGYLRELQGAHHFDALIEKPPTTTKLVEVMSRLCHWKEPPPGWTSAQLPMTQPPMPPSGLRKESIVAGESPTSASSGFRSLASLSYRGSSREDSLSTTSTWTDADARSDDMLLQNAKPVIGDWRSEPVAGDGLGILEGGNFAPPAIGFSNVVPKMPQYESAPGALEAEMNPHALPRRSPSAEAKKRAALGGVLGRADTGEFGDDEDEELGNVRPRSKSPQPRVPHQTTYTSKLSTEMLRTNSQGSVVSPADSTGASTLRAPSPMPPHDDATTFFPPDTTVPLLRVPSNLSPPEIFPHLPGTDVQEFDMDKTPTPQPQPEEFASAPPPPLLTPAEQQPVSNPIDPDPTPKASRTASTYPPDGT